MSLKAAMRQTRSVSQATSLTERERQLVASSLAGLAPAATLVGELFCRRAVNLDSGLAPVFGAPDGSRVAQAALTLKAALANSDHESTLRAIARLLGAHARGRGLRREDYVTCVDALFWTLERSLRTDFTPELRSAWGQFALMMTGLMMGEAADKPVRAARKRRA